MEPTRVSVKVMFRTITPWWDKLRVWSEFQVEMPSCGHIECLLSVLLSQLTSAEPSAEWAIKYRQRFLRSPRVDDVLLIGETAWRLESSDQWARISLQADEVVVVDGLTRMRERQS